MNRYIFFRILVTILLLPSSIFFLIIYFPVVVQSRGSFFFKQKRVGRNRKIFTIYKIRTMVKGADTMRASLLSKNEADGPVFKIKDDPRYTNIGRWLAQYGLDELPQLVNIHK